MHGEERLVSTQSPALELAPALLEQCHAGDLAFLPIRGASCPTYGAHYSPAPAELSIVWGEGESIKKSLKASTTVPLLCSYLWSCCKAHLAEKKPDRAGKWHGKNEEARWAPPGPGKGGKRGRKAASGNDQHTDLDSRENTVVNWDCGNTQLGAAMSLQPGAPQGAGVSKCHTHCSTNSAQQTGASSLMHTLPSCREIINAPFLLDFFSFLRCESWRKSNGDTFSPADTQQQLMFSWCFSCAELLRLRKGWKTPPVMPSPARAPLVFVGWCFQERDLGTQSFLLARHSFGLGTWKMLPAVCH